MRASMPAFDSIQGYEDARADRMWDGVALWSLDRDHGACYLMGFAAEMALKSAYFRYQGHPIVQPIGRAELDTATSLSNVLGVTAGREGFHSVLFWVDLLLATRSARSQPLKRAAESLLRSNVQTVYDIWWIDMRYKSAAATSRHELERLAAATSWIDKNYVALYS